MTAVFVVWFVSGIIFVYVGMPTLPAEERLKRLEPLDLRDLNVTPSAAVARLELDGTPGRLWIAMLDGLRGFAE